MNLNKYVKLNILEKQKYIKTIKDNFEKILSRELGLIRVSAPLFVTPQSGLQDNLNGVEKRVEFKTLKDGQTLEIVQSLAKWKRYALKKYNFNFGDGLYTDMTAIRCDDIMDKTHSIYVDQWDWEKVISNNERNINFLKNIVQKIVNSIIETAEIVKKSGFSNVDLTNKVYFITSEELLKMYPNLNSKQREYEITKKYKTVFIIGIGEKLSNNMPHDLRAPDYDDWQLNGDLFFYHNVLDMALEISSMGIRVNKQSLIEQLRKTNNEERLNLEYHNLVIQNKLPLTIGGGIGQSRLCQLLLARAHIGEVQCSYWDKENIDYCKEHNIELL